MDILMDMLNTKTLSITHDILSLIAKIDEFKGAWRALATLAPERLLALRRVATIESIIEQNKQGYYLALRQTQGTIRTESPQWGAWVLFFLRSLDAQMTRLKAKVEREKLILAVLPELSLQLLELAKERGRITVQEAVILTAASRNTIKLHLQKLVAAGHLTRHGAGRGVWYSLA